MTNKTVTMSRELAERLALPPAGANGWTSWNTAVAYEAAKELRALLAAPVVERQPVAWLVTDIHGQKKALRAGAEGIERHRNSGSTLVPLFDHPPSQVTVGDGWYTDECGNLRFRPEEEPPAPVVPEAIALLRRVVACGALTFDSQPDFESLETDICACLDKVKELNE